jgi:hypothetical protein
MRFHLRGLVLDAGNARVVGRHALESDPAGLGPLAASAVNEHVVL